MRAPHPTPGMAPTRHTAAAIPQPARPWAAFGYEWLLLVVALVLIGGLTAYTLYDDYQSTNARERERLTEQAEIVHDSLVRQLDSVDRALLNIRAEWPAPRLPDATAMRAAIPRLKAFVDAMPGVRGLFILDAQGILRASNFTQLIGSNFRERAYFQAARQNPQRDTLYLSPPFRTALGAWVINLVRMIPGPRGEFAGVVVAALDPEEFQLVLRSINYAPDMSSTLAHGNGELFLVEPERTEHLGMNLNQPDSLFSRHMQSGQPATLYTGTVYRTGESRMLAQRTIQPASLRLDHPLVIALGRDLDALHAPWRRNLLARGSLFGLLTLGSVLGLYLQQRRRLRVQQQIQQAREELQQKTEELQQYFDVAHDMLCITDRHGRLLNVNTAWQRVLGHPPTELQGRSYTDLLHPDDQAAARTAFERLAQGHKVVGLNNRCRHRDGSYRDLEWQFVPHGDSIFADARDVTQARKDQQAMHELNTQLQAQSATLRSLVFIDGLTGVANRRRFDETLHIEWRQGLRQRTPLAVLMLDVDHFKAYNDQAGHQAGDVVLRTLALAMRERLGRPHDLLARYGGEEFVCLLPDTDLAGAQAKAEELRQAVLALGIPHAGSAAAAVVTVSIGVATRIPDEDGSPEQLLRAADAALYAAKSSGRNRVCSRPG